MERQPAGGLTCGGLQVYVSVSASSQKWGVNERSEEPDRLNNMTGKYAAVSRAVAAEAGIPVLDLWTGVPLRLALPTRSGRRTLPRAQADHASRILVVGNANP